MKWKVIGNTLGIELAVLDAIKADNEHSIQHCVEKVFNIWIENASGLPNKNYYPYSWSGLLNLLMDCELATLAEKYFTFLKGTTPGHY